MGADLLVGGGLLKTAGKVDDGDINGWDTECHSGELSLEGRNDLGGGLGGSGGGWDNVAGGGTSSAPVLAGGGVDHGLGGGHGVDGGHEVLLNNVLVLWMALTMGARPLVVHDAHEIKSAEPSYSSSWLTPMTMVWVSSFAGAR